MSGAYRIIGDTMRLYGRIAKFEKQADGTVLVEGIASSQCVDSDGETVTAAAMKAALPDYMKHPALREMHQLSAAGKTIAADVSDDGNTYITAKVVDPTACLKVLEGVYTGFSIGGKITKGGRPGNSKTIDGITLNEISLVDVPSNPKAVFQICKIADAEPEKPVETPLVKVADVDTLAKLSAAETALTAANESLTKVTAERNDLQQKLNAKALELKAAGVAKDPKFIERVAHIDALEKGLHDAHLACEQAGDAIEKVAAERDGIAKKLVAAEESHKLEKAALVKAHADALEKLQDALNDSEKHRGTMATDLAEAKVALATKGVLKAVPVEKKDDLEKRSDEDESEKPAEGTPARVIYEIKKAHARGAAPLGLAPRGS